MSTRYVLLLFGLRLHLGIILSRLILPGTTLEGDSAHYNQVYIVTAKTTHTSAILMMEQTHTRKRHCNAVFVTRLDNMVVTHTAASLRNILHA